VLPLYWVVIAVFLLTLHHGVPHREWWRFPLLLQGFWPDTVATVDGPAWTLAVEVQFYLLLPVVAWLLLRRGLASATAGLLLAVAALVPLRIVGVDLRPESSLRWAYSLPANDVFFLPGMLLALGVAARESGALTVRAPAWLARADVLLVAAFACFAGAVADFRFSILAGLGSGLLLAAVALPLRSTPVLRLLDLRGVVFLGAISYGVYLWHEPLIARLHHAGLGGGTLILLVVGAAVAVAASAVSHVLVERPFLRLKDRQRR
jgi:peptidoglycan/LPS O-acetylase OafA/YrhL